MCADASAGVSRALINVAANETRSQLRAGIPIRPIPSPPAYPRLFPRIVPACPCLGQCAVYTDERSHAIPRRRRTMTTRPPVTSHAMAAPATDRPAIRTEGVSKRFGATVALAGVSLEIEESTVFGLLGPNGAGKTTLVRVLTTLLRPDAGHAEVFGRDVVRDPAAVRELIGLTGQFAAVDELLTGRENLEMFGRLFHLAPAEARSAGGRAARSLRPGRRRRSTGANLLGRDAQAARPGLELAHARPDAVSR